MNRRRWLLSCAIFVGAAAAIVSVLVMAGKNRSDCDTVQQMLDFNQAHNAAVTQTGSHGPVETPISDYENWASRLKTYAGEMHDGTLAPHAEHLAALASQTVAIVGQARDDGSRSSVAEPPPWVDAYAKLNEQFEGEVSALTAACPR